MKPLLTSLLIAFGVQCVFAPSGFAQTNCFIIGESCLASPPNGIGITTQPPIPIDANVGQGDGAGCVGWTVKIFSCVKVPFPVIQASCTTCAAAKAASPINLTTGDTFIIQNDVSVPGLGGGLVLTRTWNSILPAEQKSYGGMFGMNWRTNLEERLVYNSPDKFLKLSNGDGSVWSFATETASSTIGYRVVAPANQLTRVSSGDTNYTVTEHDGSKKLFDSITGLLLSIIDRNGNATQLSYDTANRLSTVTDPASRHLYFNYPDNTSTLVSSVTSDVGISLSYTYDTNGRLIKVTRPDNTTVSFDYDVNSMITAVRDNEGKILESHTYDSLGRGITGSSANGVESVTVTYP